MAQGWSIQQHIGGFGRLSYAYSGMSTTGKRACSTGYRGSSVVKSGGVRFPAYRRNDGPDRFHQADERSDGKLSTNVPGLLFIDTPGHQAFTTLRARGGALADMAIVVVDINQGFQPQTIEALQILRACKTPFVLAATEDGPAARLETNRVNHLPRPTQNRMTVLRSSSRKRSTKLSASYQTSISLQSGLTG